jgi:hypothetical protein
MERDGLQAEELLERGGEEVLSVMLLHVIEPTRPVNLTVHHVVIEYSVEGVPDDVFVIGLHVENADFIEQATIRWLTTAFGVEGGPIECNRVAVPGDDVSRKAAQVGIDEVEALSHAKNLRT